MVGASYSNDLRGTDGRLRFSVALRLLGVGQRASASAEAAENV